MTIVSDSVLTESKTARNNQLAALSHDRANEVLNKIKSLYFALWQGVGTATTEQVAEFYEVSSDVVRDNLRRHRDEFDSDGLKILKGKALNEVREIISLTSQSVNVTIWTPRAALRLGMLLRDSEVARTVRTSLLDAVERTLPAQSQEIDRLKLELALAQTRERLIASTQALALINPALPALAFGQPDAVIEVEIPTTLMVDEQGHVIEQYDGCSITWLAKRYGFGTGRKATERCKAWLASIGVKEEQWVEELAAHTTRKLPRQMLSYLDRQFSGHGGDRQRYLGEAN